MGKAKRAGIGLVIWFWGTVSDKVELGWHNKNEQSTVPLRRHSLVGMLNTTCVENAIKSLWKAVKSWGFYTFLSFFFLFFGGGECIHPFPQSPAAHTALSMLPWISLPASHCSPALILPHPFPHPAAQPSAKGLGLFFKKAFRLGKSLGKWYLLFLALF